MSSSSSSSSSSSMTAQVAVTVAIPGRTNTFVQATSVSHALNSKVRKVRKGSKRKHVPASSASAVLPVAHASLLGELYFGPDDEEEESMPPTKKSSSSSSSSSGGAPAKKIQVVGSVRLIPVMDLGDRAIKSMAEVCAKNKTKKLLVVSDEWGPNKVFPFRALCPGIQIDGISTDKAIRGLHTTAERNGNVFKHTESTTATLRDMVMDGVYETYGQICASYADIMIHTKPNDWVADLVFFEQIMTKRGQIFLTFPKTVSTAISLFFAMMRNQKSSLAVLDVFEYYNKTNAMVVFSMANLAHWPRSRQPTGLTAAFIPKPGAKVLVTNDDNTLWVGHFRFVLSSTEWMIYSPGDDTTYNIDIDMVTRTSAYLD
jgi:hypothetical protein